MEYSIGRGDKWIRRGVIAFFLLTSFFALTWRAGHFQSPDESANAFFIRQYVRVGTLRVAEPLNVIAGDRIHPRAINIVRHDLVPGSFLGMILWYGWIAGWVGLWVLPLLSPFFAALGSLFFYKLVRFLFDERTARWSLVLLLVHPAWLYYTSRSLFPNVLFTSFLIVGLYALLVKRYPLFGGLLIGAALTVRTAEAGWVLSGLCLLWFFYRTHIRWHEVVRVGIGIVAPFIPIFLQNVALYGHPLYSGYAQIDSEAVPAAFAWHFESRFLTTLFSLFLPFGIKPSILLGNIYRYGVWIFWWLAVPALLGFVISVKNKITRYAFFYALMVFWLFLYYGSWEFHDTTLAGATLGTSYVRYWLPAFVFGIPFAVQALFAVRQSWLRVGALSLIIILSIATVLWRGSESLVAMRATTRVNNRITKAVLSRTESTAVLLTERTDKLFFPERRVIFNDPLDQQKTDRVIARLRTRVPVYYFTELKDHDIAFINERRLAQYGVAWQEGEDIGGQRLYSLEIISNQ